MKFPKCGIDTVAFLLKQKRDELFEEKYGAELMLARSRSRLLRGLIGMVLFLSFAIFTFYVFGLISYELLKLPLIGKICLAGILAIYGWTGFFLEADIFKSKQEEKNLRRRFEQET